VRADGSGNGPQTRYAGAPVSAWYGRDAATLILKGQEQPL